MDGIRTQDPSKPDTGGHQCTFSGLATNVWYQMYKIIAIMFIILVFCYFHLYRTLFVCF